MAPCERHCGVLSNLGQSWMEEHSDEYMVDGRVIYDVIRICSSMHGEMDNCLRILALVDG